MKLVLAILLFVVGCTPHPAAESPSPPAPVASVPAAAESAPVHEWHYYPAASSPYVYRGTSPYSDFDYRRHRF